MNFQDAEKTYKDLKAQHDTGKLNDAAFETEVGKLRLQDDQGRWWQLGVQTGEWYVHDGQKWNKSKPPTPTTPKIAANVPPDKSQVPATTPAPKSANDKKLKADLSAAQPRASAMPRLFSAKPAGREGGGLPTRILVGIIAAVAVIATLIIIVAYFALSGNLGGATAKATATPTRAIAALPTSALPTLPSPTARPTEILLPPPTPVVTATAALTSTTPITATRTRAAAVATATKKPGTPAPAATATVNAPPGVYVTKLDIDPAKPNIGDTLGFKMTLLNTTGAAQAYRWIIKVYKCPDQCTGDTAFKNSYGESLKIDSTVVPGTVELVTPKHVNAGIGNCNYIAIPHYIDPISQQVIPFQTAQGGALYVSFTVCR